MQLCKNFSDLCFVYSAEQEVILGEIEVKVANQVIKAAVSHRKFAVLAEALANLACDFIGGGKNAGEVTVRLEKGGRIVNGNGADTDILVASAKAYINALNLMQAGHKAHPQVADV